MDRETFKKVVLTTPMLCDHCQYPMGFSRWYEPALGELFGVYLLAIFVCTNTKCGAKKAARLRKPLFASAAFIDYMDW